MSSRDHGHVVIVASAGGAIDGGTSLGGVDSVVASFDGATGNSRWRQVYSTDRDDRASLSGSRPDLGRLAEIRTPAGQR